MSQLKKFTHRLWIYTVITEYILTPSTTVWFGTKSGQQKWLLKWLLNVICYLFRTSMAEGTGSMLARLKLTHFTPDIAFFTCFPPEELIESPQLEKAGIQKAFYKQLFVFPLSGPH